MAEQLLEPAERGIVTFYPHLSQTIHRIEKGAAGHVRALSQIRQIIRNADTPSAMQFSRASDLSSCP